MGNISLEKTYLNTDSLKTKRKIISSFHLYFSMTCLFKKAYNPFLLLALFFVTGLYAQESVNSLSPDKKLTQYTLDIWTPEDGLPSNGQNRLLQTKDGYLWIATYNGLIRFDGASFKAFNKSNIESFSNNNIYDIKSDNKGGLWLGTHSEGLIAFKNDGFIKYPSENNFPYVIQTICIDNLTESIWIGTRGNGVFKFKDGKYTKLNLGKEFKNLITYRIIQDRKGKLWISTEDSGLFSHINGKTEHYTTENGFPANRSGSLFIDKKENLWVGTSKGVYIYDGKSFNHFKHLKNYWVDKILVDKFNNYWFATEEGLARYNPIKDNTSWLNQNNGLPHQEITDITFDIEGSLWISTARAGLLRLKQGKFTTFSQKEGLFASSVSSICELEKDKFLVGTDGGVINLIDDNKISIFPVKNKLPSRIRDINKTSDGNILISTYNGILKISPNGKEKWLTNKNILPHQTVRITYEDKEKNIWVATRTGGVIKIKPDNSTVHFTVENGLSSDFVMSISAGNDNDVIIGTNNGGINIISGDKIIKTYTQKDGLASDLVFNSYMDDNGILWVVTSNGISRLENGKFFNITYENGLAREEIFDFIEDDLGQIWLPTSNGIMQVLKAELNGLAKGKMSKLYCRMYDKQDGMVVSEVTGAAHALKASSGKIWFPTLGGVVIVDPHKIPINLQKPPVLINNLSVDGSNLNLNDKITIQQGQKRYIIDYTALSLLAPSKVYFKYQLVNFDKDWIDIGTQRQAVYTNLSGGEYTFKVIACNNDGIWNNEGTSVSFIVESAFYQKPWFLALGFVLIILFATGLFKLRLYKIQQDNIKLEEIVKKRTKEIQQKNDELLIQKEKIEGQKANISQKNEQLEQINEELKALNEEKNNLIGIVAHDLRNPLTHIDGLVNIIKMTAKNLDNEQNEYINLIKNSTARLQQMITKILDIQAVESKTLNIVLEEKPVSPTLIEAISNMENLAAKKNISINTNIEAKDVKAAVDTNFLMLVYENLLSNAIKFSPKNKKIDISLVQQNGLITTEITDEGPGISKEDQTKLFEKFQTLSAKGTDNESSTGLGLSIVKKYTEAMNGNVICISEEGKGAKFIVTFNVV